MHLPTISLITTLALAAHSFAAVSPQMEAGGPLLARADYPDCTNDPSECFGSDETTNGQKCEDSCIARAPDGGFCRASCSIRRSPGKVPIYHYSCAGGSCRSKV